MGYGLCFQWPTAREMQDAWEKSYGANGGPQRSVVETLGRGPAHRNGRRLHAPLCFALGRGADECVRPYTSMAAARTEYYGLCLITVTLL